MKLVDAGRLQSSALLGRHRGGGELSRLRIVVQALEKFPHPGRYGCAAFGAEPSDAGEIGDRQNAGNDGHGDARRPGPVAEPEKDIDIEKELGDGLGRAGVDLALEIVEVAGGALGLGMALRVGGDADFEIGDAAQAGDQAAVALATGPERLFITAGCSIPPGTPAENREAVATGARG